MEGDAAQKQPENSKRIFGHPWPKGVSGNPGGRPKNNHTSIINLLEKTLENEAPEGEGQTYKELIVERWLNTILDQDDKQKIAALKEALDRLYGKPKETIDAKVSGSLSVGFESLVKAMQEADRSFLKEGHTPEVGL